MKRDLERLGRRGEGTEYGCPNARGGVARGMLRVGRAGLAVWCRHCKQAHTLSREEALAALAADEAEAGVFPV